MPTRRHPIVVIEDDPFDVQLLTNHLTVLELAHPIIVCEDGAEAIAALQVFADSAEHSAEPLPAAILVDLNLPGIDGFSVMRWIRQQRRLASVPLAVVSGSDDPQAITDAYDCGADEFIRKPVDPLTLKYFIVGDPQPKRSAM